MKAKTKCVIFDFDGIIYDSEQINYEANQHAFERAGISFTTEEYRQLWIIEGLDLPDIVSRYKLRADPEAIRKRKNERCKEIFMHSASIISNDVESSALDVLRGSRAPSIPHIQPYGHRRSSQRSLSC